MKLFLAFILFFAALSSAVDPADPAASFNYVAFNQQAIEQIDSEISFLAELYETPAHMNIVMGAFVVDYDTEISKSGVGNLLEGARGIAHCLRAAGTNPEQIKAVWEQILEPAPDANTGGHSLECAAGAPLTVAPRLNAGSMAHNSAVPVANLASADEPFAFNPVLSALIQTYKAKQLPSNELLEEKVANTIYYAAARRPTIGAATLLDFNRLKFRHQRDVNLKLYVAESTLSNEARLGIRMLAQCMRADAPIVLFREYARARELPPDSLLLNQPCLGAGPAGATIQDLRDNFIRMGMAIEGANVFMQTGYSLYPTYADLYVYGIAQNSEPHRRTAIRRVLEADAFINSDVAAMRATLASQQNFKGVGFMTSANKAILTDILEKRFLSENADRIRTTETIKSVAQGVESCAMGEIVGLSVSRATLFVVGGLNDAPGPLKVLGTLALTGFIAYGVYETSHQAKDLLTKWHEMPASEKIFDLCQVSTFMLDLGTQGYAHLSEKIKAAKAEG
ncbi:MAG: hypothetical protein Q8P02_03990, partial [Candidatus Micrarchaeota archaeon]|nr:hypothetical protein [Candidatus Micrarchaeota archaeon]